MRLYETSTTYNHINYLKDVEEYIKETHIVDAFSVSDAETRIIEELYERTPVEPNAKVHAIKESIIDNVILDDTKSFFFQLRFQYLNPRSKVLRVLRTEYILIQADDTAEAERIIRHLYRNCPTPFHIHTVKQINIADVYLKEFKALSQSRIEEKHM